MTPDELLPGRPIGVDYEKIVILVSGNSFHWHRIYPCKWYGFRMYWLVFNYALGHSRSNFLCTVWIENETGNDELLAEYKDGKTIFEADLRYMRPTRNGT